MPSIEMCKPDESQMVYLDGNRFSLPADLAARLYLYSKMQQYQMHPQYQARGPPKYPMARRTYRRSSSWSAVTLFINILLWSLIFILLLWLLLHMFFSPMLVQHHLTVWEGTWRLGQHAIHTGDSQHPVKPVPLVPSGWGEKAPAAPSVVKPVIDTTFIPLSSTSAKAGGVTKTKPTVPPLESPKTGNVSVNHLLLRIARAENTSLGRMQAYCKANQKPLAKCELEWKRISPSTSSDKFTISYSDTSEQAMLELDNENRVVVTPDTKLTQYVVDVELLSMLDEYENIDTDRYYASLLLWIPKPDRLVLVFTPRQYCIIRLNDPKLACLVKS